jgi:ribosomal-protein-alanine N-acetyltransferase
MSDEISIRRALMEDAAVVLGIERSCAEAPHWSEGLWSQVFSQRSIYGMQRSLQGTQRICFVAEQAGAITGFIVTSMAGTVGVGIGVAEMESVAVRENARRRGVGRSLCVQAVLWAQTMGAQSMELEVRSASVAAIALYRSLGFVAQGRRRGYYSDPEDDAVLMALALSSSPGEAKV